MVPPVSLLYWQDITGGKEQGWGDDGQHGSWESGNPGRNTASWRTCREMREASSENRERKSPSGKSLSDKRKDVFVFRLMCKDSTMPFFFFFFHIPNSFSSLRISVKNYNPFPALISKLLVSSSPCILLSDIISAPTYTITAFSFATCRCSGSDDKLKPKVASSASLSTTALDVFVIPNLLLLILIAPINQLPVLGEQRR